jgi:hypothetical protein
VAGNNVLIDYTKWILKWVGIVVGSLLVIALLIGGGSFGWDWWNHDRYLSKLYVLAYNENANLPKKSTCKDAYPIFVGFVNRSSRTVENITISITAHLPGHSTDILDNGWVSMDNIVKPGDMFGLCYNLAIRQPYKMDLTVDKAEYEGKVTSVTFSDTESK